MGARVPEGARVYGAGWIRFALEPEHLQPPALGASDFSSMSIEDGAFVDVSARCSCPYDVDITAIVDFRLGF